MLTLVFGTAAASRDSTPPAAVRVRTTPSPAVAPTAVPVAPATAPAVEPAPSPTLADRVATAVGDGTSCVVVKTPTETVAAVRGDAPLVPASTQKVLVGAAALEALGPSHTFTTRVVAGPPMAPGEYGDLWLVGGADPLLATPAYESYLASNPRWYGVRPTSLSALADSLVAAGVRRVHGGLWGDDSRHGPAERVLPSWKPGYLTGGSVTPISALAVNHGFASWAPSKTPAGDPPTHAASELMRLLKERGVSFGVDAASRPAPVGTATVAEVSSAPLREHVASMLRASDNVAAELLLREIGLRRSGQATTAAGSAAATDVLARSGINPAGITLADGSGLSPDNRATCGSLVDALSSRPGGVSIADLLATAGRDGTLNRRYTEAPYAGALRGKTGWISGVVGLTGTINVGTPITFAVVQNGVSSLGEGRAIEARVLEAIVAAS